MIAVPHRLAFVLCLAAVLLVAGCQTYSSPLVFGPLQADSGKLDRGDLLGAGATFPSVLYQAWFFDYHQLAPGVRTNYQSVGSGAGIQQFIDGTLDFGATDAPMSDADLQRAPRTQHLPTVLGAVAISYNLPGLQGRLRLDADVTAGIFLGAIRSWDDPAIQRLNPQLALPAQAVSVIHRSDSSGTSYVFTDWLNKASAAWKPVGRGKSPNWPAGIGGPGNEGVARLLRQTPGAIGYVELTYIASLGLPAADVLNGAGSFVAPSIASVSAAAEGVELPADYRVSLTGSAQPGGYPVSSFTYLLINRDPKDCTKARILLHLLWWMYHDPAAAERAAELVYAPLPAPVVTRVEQSLLAVTCDGKAVLQLAGS